MQDGGTTWRRSVARLVVLAGVALAVVLAASGPSGAAPAQNPLEPLVYEIRTRAGADNGPCNTARSVSAVVGVPTPVDLGGSILPDVSVTVLAVPGVGGGPDTVQLSTTRLLFGVSRARLEIVLRPSAGEQERIALGFDACKDGMANLFHASAVSADDGLDVAVKVDNPRPSMAILGSRTDVVDSQPTRTAVRARMAPMPLTATLAVDILPEDAYHAELATSSPTNLSVEYVDSIGAASTAARAEVATFPGRLAVDFDPNSLEYLATRSGGEPLRAPIDQVAFHVTTISPGEDTTEIDADLRSVPATARLERTTDTRVSFVAPDAPIGTATVGFASYDPATTPPGVVSGTGQYLVADVAPGHAVAEVRVAGLRSVEVDAGDPVVVDLVHSPGRFDLDARVQTATETRVVDGRIIDLPADAYVDFSPSTQAFNYTGSDEIGELDVEVTSSVPFVDDADVAHLLARGVPTGLTGRLDAVGETFFATLLDGAVDLVEVQVTSGPDERLPVGVDGVVVEDHVGSYAAFARIQGLQHVDVGWSDEHQYADVRHTAGPFQLRVDTDDTDTRDLEVDGELLDLPAQARFDHIAALPTPCPPGSTETECETPLFVTFASEDPAARIGRLTFDVVSAEPLVATATQAQLVATDLPPLQLTVDATGERFVATTTGGTLGSVAAEICDDAGCGLLALTGPDGAFLVDLHDIVTAYDAVVRLSGLRHAEVAWGSPVEVDLDHDPGTFDVFVEQDYDVVVPNNPSPLPPPPCDLPKPRDCEILEDPDEPLPPDSHVVTHRRSLQVHLADLPTTVDLTYDPELQTVDYLGGGDIGSLEAHYTDGRALVGRARFAHLFATGLPTNLHLRWSFSPVLEELVADTAGTTLGHVQLELLSDPSLRDAVYQSPGFRDGFDGFVLWDLQDFEGSTFEPVDDAYVIAARVTGLQHLDYVRGAYDDGTFGHDRVAVDLRRSGRTPLWVEVQQADDSRDLRTIPGLTQQYRAELINVDYADPPEHLGFEFDHRTRGVHDVYDLHYYGSSTGQWIRFLSNIGDNSDVDFNPLIDIVATPVPGGGDSLAAPGVDVCIGSNNMRCSDVNREPFDTGQFSMALLVTEPVTLSGRYDAGDASVRVGDVFIQHGIVASSEENNDGLNSTSLYIDTRGGVVEGTIRVLEKNIGGNLDTQELIHMPPGFMAFAREVEMEYEGTGFSHGRVICPDGFLLTHEAIGIDVNLEGRFCARPRIDSVTDLDGNAPVLTQGTHELIVNGTNFVPTIDGNQGTLFTVGDWHIDPQTRLLTYETDIVVTAMEWIDISTVRLVVEVTGSAGPGSYRLSAFNPISFPLNVAVLDAAITVADP